MKKRVLVLTLALIVAVASSAMAAVNFSGRFTASIEQKNFKIFQEGYTLKASVTSAISISAKNVTTITKEVEVEEEDEETGEIVLVIKEEEEEIVNWEFAGGLNTIGTGAALTGYKLALYDQYFDAYVWNGAKGTAYYAGDKGTQFGLISAPTAGGPRARLVVPVVDIAKITLDLEPEDNLRFFVDGEVGDFNVGLAYARKDWTTDATNNIVAHASGKVDAGVELGLKAAAGVTLGDELGYAVGFGVNSALTDEIAVEASVTNGNGKFKGDAVNAKATAINGKVTYTESMLKAWVGGGVTLADTNKNSVNVGVRYRMSEAVAYDWLFADGGGAPQSFYDLDAPAVGLDLKLEDMKFQNVAVHAASPVVDNVWVKAKADFAGKDKITANVLAHILATDKLTLRPSVGYATEGKAIDLQLGANYKIGLSGTAVALKVQKVFQEDKNGAELIEASISIPF